jgi:hypothetical protein
MLIVVKVVVFQGLSLNRNPFRLSKGCNENFKSFHFIALEIKNANHFNTRNGWRNQNLMIENISV